MILLLEDDRDRIRRFRSVMRRLDPSLTLMIWRDAHLMCREVGEYLERARLISLDHDLEPESAGSEDPGDGLLVVKALVTRKQPCPVIVHSSNRTRSDWMAGEFELARWKSRSVSPIGERWIEEYWRVVARELLGSSSSQRSESTRSG